MCWQAAGRSPRKQYIRRLADVEPPKASPAGPVSGANMPTIRAHLPYSLAHQEIRRACTVVEHILRAGDMLDELPPDALAAIRDYCSEYVKDRKGKFSDFKRAWVEMVIEHLDDARLRERRLYTGIIGREDKSA
jgi:hypothetical protein